MSILQQTHPCLYPCYSNTLLLIIFPSTAPSRPGQWLNAKQSLNETGNEATSRVEQPDSSEDEANNTLQRKRKVNANTAGPQTSTAQKQQPNKTPRPRGRPRKEKPFEVRQPQLIV